MRRVSVIFIVLLIIDRKSSKCFISNAVISLACLCSGSSQNIHNCQIDKVLRLLGVMSLKVVPLQINAYKLPGHPHQLQLFRAIGEIFVRQDQVIPI